MSDSSYITFEINNDDLDKWLNVFKALERSGFGAKFQIAIEELSQEAGDFFEELIEDCGEEFGIFEGWSREKNQFQLECELTGCWQEDFCEILRMCGATNIDAEIPE